MAYIVVRSEHKDYPECNPDPDYNSNSDPNPVLNNNHIPDRNPNSD